MLTVAFGAAFFFFNDTATTEIYTLSLHDALPIWKSQDNFRRIVANAPSAVEHLSSVEWPWKRTLSFQRWRGPLAGRQGRTAVRRPRTDGNCGCARQSKADLSHHRCQGGRTLPLGGRRKEFHGVQGRSDRPRLPRAVD